jgi:demethoxyubiquinone hydroxylase (CLK1/Coq7/Cat5 family)
VISEQEQVNELKVENASLRSEIAVLKHDIERHVAKTAHYDANRYEYDSKLING